MLTHSSIRIGDRARFPLGRLGDTATYRHSFEAVAFRSGAIVARRLADGCTREVSDRWWQEYALEYRRPVPRELQERRRLPLPHLNTDRGRPGFYVSIQHAHKPGAYILAAGPFSYPGDADRLVRSVRAYIDQKYGSTREWWDMRIGTCKAPDGSKDGRFNQEVGITC